MSGTSSTNATDRKHASTAARKFTILAGLDFSDLSQHALGIARGMAERANAELHVVHVVPPPVGVAALGGPVPTLAGPVDFTATLDAARDELSAFCRNLAGPGGKLQGRVFGHVRMGTPAHEICQLAEQLDADLIVVGTHGRTGLGRVLLGSIAETVLRHAPCSVLTTRKPAPVPAIEPGCPRCEDARAAGDERGRCEQHARRIKAHTYSDNVTGFGHRSFQF